MIWKISSNAYCNAGKSYHHFRDVHKIFLFLFTYKHLLYLFTIFFRNEMLDLYQLRFPTMSLQQVGR